MRIAITGSAGRVGRAIRDRLLRDGHEVAGLDRRASCHTDLVGELLDRGTLDRLCDGAQAIVHVAGLHAPHVGLQPDAAFELVNVDGTQAVIEAARRHGIGRIVYTSTTALLGGSGWLDDDSPPQPRTIYHRSKLAAEALLAQAASVEGGPAVRILRMSRCFPEPAPLMAAYRLHRGVDARDVADAHARALEHEGPRCDTFVVSATTLFVRPDMPQLQADAPAVLRERAPGLVAEFRRRGWALPATIDRVYDASRAMRELRWAPRHGVASLLHLFDTGSREVRPPLPAAPAQAPERVPC